MKPTTKKQLSAFDREYMLLALSLYKEYKGLDMLHSMICKRDEVQRIVQKVSHQDLSTTTERAEPKGSLVLSIQEERSMASCTVSLSFKPIELPVPT